MKEDTRTSCEASRIKEYASTSMKLVGDTLEEEVSAYSQTNKVLNSLQKTCVRKHKEAVRLHEWEIKEAERKRLFLGLHIDRRPVHMRKKAKCHDDIGAIFKSPEYKENVDSAVKANRKSVEHRFSILKEMGFLKQMKE